MADYRVSTDIEPRFRDTDAMGHVNNAVYLTYLEVGRQHYWREMSPELDYRQVPFVMARVEIDFRSPVIVGERLRVLLRMTYCSRRSFGTEYEIRDLRSDRVVATAKSVQVCYDYERQSSMDVPASLRSGLERMEGHALPTRETSS